MEALPQKRETVIPKDFSISGIDGFPTMYVDTLDESTQVVVAIHNLRKDLAAEREARERLALQLLSVEGQCVEEHHWKGNCPAEDLRARVERLEGALREIEAVVVSPHNNWMRDIRRFARAALRGEG